MSGRKHKKRRLSKNNEIQSMSKIKDKSLENLLDIIHFTPYKRPLLNWNLGWLCVSIINLEADFSISIRDSRMKRRTNFHE